MKNKFKIGDKVKTNKFKNAKLVVSTIFKGKDFVEVTDKKGHEMNIKIKDLKLESRQIIKKSELRKMIKEELLREVALPFDNKKIKPADKKIAKRVYSDLFKIIDMWSDAGMKNNSKVYDQVNQLQDLLFKSM